MTRQRSLKASRMFIDWITTEDGFFVKIKKKLIEKKTKYQSVMIAHLGKFGKSLIIDGKVQSCVYDEYIYHEALVHPALLSHPCPKNVLIIGGGEGGTLREVLKHKSIKKAIMVDLDEEIIHLSKRYLKEIHNDSFFSNKVEIHFNDGRRFIEESDDGSFDIIIMDSTDPIKDGTSYLLFTKEFYKTVYKKLSSDGIISVQSNMVRKNEMFVFSSILKTLKSVFPITFGYSTFIPSFYTQWGFSIGSKRYDLRKLTRNNIEKRMKTRLNAKLKFLDPTTINGMLSLPMDVRKGINSSGRIIMDFNPIFSI